MKKNNFYTSPIKAKGAATEAEIIAPKEVRAEYARLNEKFKVSFCRNTKENAQMLYNITINAFKALPDTDPFKVKLEILGKLDNWQTQENVIDLMERLDFLNDYQYLRNWDTSALQFFVNNSLPGDFGIKDVTVQEILECENFTKFFNGFLIEGCNPEAIALTRDTKLAFDKLLRGLEEYQINNFGNIWYAYCNSNKTFDELHHILNPV